PVTKPNGASLNLLNGNKYFFRVKAQNIVGLVSNISESSGITVDTSLKPLNCTNGIKDEKEMDVDCGGSCSVKCADGITCRSNSDCNSGICDETTKKCASKQIVDLCTNKQQDTGELGIDCGGSCSVECASVSPISLPDSGSSGGGGGSAGSVKIKEEYKNNPCVNEGDAGKDPYTLGTTYKFGKPYFEFCEQAGDKKSYLREYSCNTDSLVKTIYFCTKGCNADENACVN
ncbi:hypothetical protein HZA96_07310, partial [Candidatus Woesearchaeota archaeon]|nr:hypothetical protein [Candidatus Woesearchaeota archaeon]